MSATVKRHNIRYTGSQRRQHCKRRHKSVIALAVDDVPTPAHDLAVYTGGHVIVPVRRPGVYPSDWNAFQLLISRELARGVRCQHADGDACSLQPPGNLVNVGLYAARIREIACRHLQHTQGDLPGRHRRYFVTSLLAIACPMCHASCSAWLSSHAGTTT